MQEVQHEVKSKPAHAKPAYAAPRTLLRALVCPTRLSAQKLFPYGKRDEYESHDITDRVENFELLTFIVCQINNNSVTPQRYSSSSFNLTDPRPSYNVALPQRVPRYSNGHCTNQ